jgi:hypothetical protein
MSEIDMFRLQQELSSLRQNNESLTERLRQRDRDEVAKAEAAKPKDNYRLQGAQRSVAGTLGNPEAVEELRAAAWVDFSLSPGEGRLYRDRAPGDGRWPEGVTAEGYVRKFHGLNESGDALAGEKPVEPEPTKLSPWLEAGIARAKEGKS